MKRLSLLLAGLLFFCGWVMSQNEKIKFNETEHDFGIIGEKDGNAYFDFILTNNTDATLIVTNVTASCGCTTPQWTREPVEPGKTGTVTAIYNPLGRIGSFSKVITVHTNQPNPVYLKIRGEVVSGELASKKVSPEVEYPIALGDYLLKAKTLNFDKMVIGEAKTIRLEVYNKSDKSITQKIQKLPKYMTVAFNPVILPAQTAATVDVSLKAEGINLYGNLSGEIILSINGTSQSFSYSAIVLDDFSKWTATKKANAGKINVSSSSIDFGKLGSGNSKIIKISNSGKSPLNVRAIQSSDPAVTVSKNTFSVSPGEIIELKVSEATKKIQSASSTLSIITDDPKMPIYEITIISKP